jgi:phosphoglycolate phosphatase
MVGDGAAKLIERALPPAEAGRDLGPLLARFLAHYGDHVCDGTVLYPGVAALLDQIAARGLAAAVLTNKPAPLARALVAALGIGDRFAAVVGDGDGYPRKPDPAAARDLIARHAGGDPTRAVVIGDGIPDLRQAHAVPCASIAAAWGYTPQGRLLAESPTYLADTPAAVSPLL